MKTKTFFHFIILLFLTFNSINSQEGTGPGGVQGFYNKYYIGIMNVGNVTWESGWNQYNSLGIDIWHAYPRHCGGDMINDGWTNWVWNDKLLTHINDYGAGVRGVLEFCAQKNMRVLMDRVKLDYLAYGQRSDYQCEDISAWSTDKWFYAYNYHGAGLDDPDNGAIVRYCQVNQNQTDGGAGWVVKGLRANREQINFRWFSHPYEIDNKYNWHVKPRIRINPQIVINNPELEVCRVDVYNFKGDINLNNRIASVTIKAKNFKNISTTYNGEYLEEFYWVPQTNNPPSAIIIDPIQTPFNPDVEPVWNTDCKVDFQVWYSGNCDMWLDYVRVDNEVAHDLFRGYYDNPAQPENQWIKNEVDIAMYNQTMQNTAFKFYIEEFEFNNIPCMAYVAQKIRQYSGGRYNLMCDLNIGETFYLHMPEHWTNWNFINASYIKRNLVDAVGLNEFFTFSYPFNAHTGPHPLFHKYHMDMPAEPFISEVPNTLLYSDYNATQGRLCIPAPPAEYEQWLQEWFDNTTNHFDDRFTLKMKLADEVSRLCGIPFVNLAQTHFALNSSTDSYNGREPTNEELAMTMYLSTSYGAKGQFYFDYFAFGPMTSGIYGRGLVNDSTYCGDGSAATPRLENAYGQHQDQGVSKFDAVREINQNLHAWGPYLMNFDNDNRKSFIYYSEMNEMAANTYIGGIYTYRPGSGGIPCVEDFPEGDTPPPNTIGECKYQRYVQAAVFKNPNEPATSKYFMVVNRRCSPYFAPGAVPRFPEGENGGRRYIKMYFYNVHNDFGTINSWNIYELPNERTPVTQFSVTNGYAELGWFMPGEGKLYKMVPTIIKGGTLAGDEVISGQSFTCEDTVISNGYNITINGGSTVSFTDSATIIMNGGTFQSGALNEGTAQTTYKGVGSGKWSGLQLNNCAVKIYNSKFQDISSPVVNYAVKMLNCPLGDKT